MENKKTTISKNFGVPRSTKNKSIDIYATDKENLKKNRSQNVLFYLLAWIFNSNKSRVLDEHWPFFSKVEPDKIIIMEKITSDFECFQDKFKIFYWLRF